jgi:transcriptional regulator with XRE-family HTH domain
MPERFKIDVRPAIAEVMRVEQARTRMGTAELARATNMGVSTLDGYRRGKTAMTVAAMFAISEALNLTPWEFTRLVAEAHAKSIATR